MRALPSALAKHARTAQAFWQLPLSKRLKSSVTDAAPRLKYWTDLWAERQDVFTLQDVNPNLVEYLQELLPGIPDPEEIQRARKKKRGLSALFGSRAVNEVDGTAPTEPRMVFVPLCGRTPDLAYLAELGSEHVHVVGLDAISEPLRLFATEFGNGLAPVAELDTRTESSAAKGLSGPTVSSYRTERYPNLTLVHGDIFAVDAGMLGISFHAVWDRGGLTSIEPGQARAAYVSRLHGMMAPRGRLLLEFLSCNLPLEGAGSVPEMTRLLRDAGFEDIRLLRQDDVRQAYPGFSPPGLTSLDEVLMVATAAALPTGGS